MVVVEGNKVERKSDCEDKGKYSSWKITFLETEFSWFVDPTLCSLFFHMDIYKQTR